MKETFIIKECGNLIFPNLNIFEPNQVKNCTGCLSCWVKTPGLCIYKDLDEFYRNFVNAGRVLLFSKVVQGFVSGNLKTLFDRMLPLCLPYISYASGEAMHEPRYNKLPRVEVYYDGTFADEGEQRIYTDYIQRVFYQFHCTCESVKPISDCLEGEIKC